LDLDKPLLIFIDQKDTNKKMRGELIASIRNVFDDARCQIEINIKPSQSEKCLQATDIISWSIFRKYERGDTVCYRIIKSRISRKYFYTL